MADRYSNIDMVFRNGLKEFEVLPPQDLWEEIRPAIGKKSRMALYLRAAAVTGLIIAGGAVTWYFSGSLSDNFVGPAITLNQDSRPAGEYLRANNPAINIKIKNEPVSAVSPGSSSIETDNASRTYPYGLQYIGRDLNTWDRLNMLLSQTYKISQLKTVSGSPVINIPGNNIALNYEAPENAPVSSHTDRWSISASASPSYYSMIGTGASEQQKALAATEKTALSYTGGMSFGFRVNRRISLQMGLYYSSMNQEIEGVKSYSGFNRFLTMKGSDYFSVATSSGTIVSKNNDIYLLNSSSNPKVSSIFSSDEFDPGKAGLNYLTGAVFQNFNYLEVPFVVRYKLIDRTLGMNLIGGISYNKLVNNSAYALADGNRYYIGITEGLNPVTLSSSIGLGLEYSFSRKISLNLEPTLQYFLTPVSRQTGSAFHPYIFGVFSGVSWKF